MDEKAPLAAGASLPTYDPEHASEQWRRQSARERWWKYGDLAWKWIFRLCVVFVWYTVIVHFNPLLRGWTTPDAGIDVPVRIQRFWGQYSPYYPAGEYTPAPTGCTITQVGAHLNVLEDDGQGIYGATWSRRCFCTAAILALDIQPGWSDELLKSRVDTTSRSLLQALRGISASIYIRPADYLTTAWNVHCSAASYHFDTRACVPVLTMICR